MNLTIFDVSHGFCAYLIADNKNVLLVDCGHNERTGFRPSNYLKQKGCTAIEYFIISNYDNDHVSDLANLRRVIPITVLYRNKSINLEKVKNEKEENGPLTSGLEAAFNISNEYIYPVTNPPLLEGITFKTYWNDYGTFTDTNNLSVVTFISYGDLKFVFPGDLEKNGWEKLMENDAFCSELKTTNIFIASHHGRINGLCEKVFEYCTPDLIIISDRDKIYDTQDVNYTQYARGISWGDQKRYVFSTRKDGSINFTKIGSNPCSVSLL